VIRSELRRLTILAVFLLLPSVGLFEKYLGQAGVLIYGAVGIPLLIFSLQPGSPLPRMFLRLKPRVAWGLVVLTFAVLIAAVVVVYPIANSGIVGGGSDSDDSIDQGVRALWAGRYPYDELTYLGQPVVALTGGLLLSTPAVMLLGGSAYQNVFWLALFFWVLLAQLRDVRLALLLLWLMFGLAPATFYGVLNGTDHIASALAVLVLTYWMMAEFQQKRRRVWLAVFGVALALGWRPNLLWLLPLIVMAVQRNAGWRTAGAAGSVMLLVLLATNLPFYLSNPVGYAPLHANFDLVRWLAGPLVPVLTGLLALVLAVIQPRPCEARILFRNCAWVLALPIWCLFLAYSAALRQVSWYFAAYGIFALFFSVTSYGVDLLAAAAQSPGKSPAPVAPVRGTK
jgi:hypothetical protein